MELHEFQPLFLVDNFRTVWGVGHDELFMGYAKFIQVFHELKVVLVVKSFCPDPDHRLERRWILTIGVFLGEGPCIVPIGELDVFRFLPGIVSNLFLRFIARASWRR